MSTGVGSDLTGAEDSVVVLPASAATESGDGSWHASRRIRNRIDPHRPDATHRRRKFQDGHIADGKIKILANGDATDTEQSCMLQVNKVIRGRWRSPALAVAPPAIAHAVRGRDEGFASDQRARAGDRCVPR